MPALANSSDGSSLGTVDAAHVLEIIYENLSDLLAGEVSMFGMCLSSLVNMPFREKVPFCMKCLGTRLYVEMKSRA